MTPIPVTLSSAAACALLNIWLGSRIAAFRKEYHVSVGDGGHEPLMRRMRAQSNFIEHAPFVLILLGGLEISGANRIALAVIAAVFIAARISHGIGMLRIKDAPFAAAMRAYFDREIEDCTWITPALHKRRSNPWRRLKWAFSHFLVNMVDYTVTRRLNFRPEL